jgi:histidinol-phosphate aminotransferase
MTSVSRRSLLGAASASAALAASPGLATAQAAPAFSAAGFGPAPGEAMLAYNENPYGPSPAAKRAMAELASRGCYYPDDAEQRLADVIAARVGVPAEQVVLGNGSTEVLRAVTLGWARDGAIAAPELTFEDPVMFARSHGARLIRAPLAADMGIDLDALAAAIGPGVSLVYLCNPNNPTGMMLDPAALRAFVRAVAPRATVLVDEAYNELTDRPEANSLVDLVREGQNVIVTRTFSKIHGMAGLRVGYAIASPAHAARIRALHTTAGLNSAGLAAALASHDDTTFLAYSRDRIAEARAIILAATQRQGLRSLPSQTNFVFVEVPDADRLRAEMARRRILIRGAYGPWKRWSRVSTGRIEDVRRYADALPEALRA